MAFVITQRCCNDASCVDVCPVDCIRPTPGDPGFAATEMLHIDPTACIDCGACVPACPVHAIRYEDDLPEPMARYAEINAAYFERHPLQADTSLFHEPHPRPSAGDRLRVAIVGAGPAACYAADELLAHSAADIEMFERLPTPYGLIRAGVAPDHPETKYVASVLGGRLDNDAFNFHLNVEVGKHISHEELMRYHHAVIYAVGAFEERKLGVPGENLPGCHTASEFVAWYNGHPDFADATFNLSGDRAVIVGNGNVALDIARILVADVGVLRKTDIAEHALDALRQSNIEEVVLLGRRGPLQAAYSSSEFLALGYLPGVDIVVDEDDLRSDATIAAALDQELEPSLAMRMSLASEYAHRPVSSDHKRVVFRFLVSPSEIIGTESVEGVRVVKNELVERAGTVLAQPTGDTEEFDASLVLSSVGFRGRRMPNLPFDDGLRRIPNDHGRVVGDDGQAVPGVYVAGWIKRGATGTIGTNKHCARETVANVMDDFASGRLSNPDGDHDALRELLAERQPNRLSGEDWRRIERIERKRGKDIGRPRLKFTDAAEMVDVAERFRHSEAR